MVIWSAVLVLAVLGIVPQAILAQDCAPLGMESGAIPDESITASSVIVPENTQPYFGRLNRSGRKAAWVAASQTPGEWLQVDLGAVKQVCGVITQGRPKFGGLIDQWVTSYKLQFSSDGRAWTTYKGIDGIEKVFTANTDQDTKVTNMLDTPVVARYVRFVVQSWVGYISMRAEILGKEIEDCAPLGMESGAISNYRITASSVFSRTNTQPYFGRLNRSGLKAAWVAARRTAGEWLQVDLGEVKQVCGVITQGRPQYGGNPAQWVTSYKLQFSSDGSAWTTYKGRDGTEKVFTGNMDKTTEVTNMLDTPVVARYVRFVVQSWVGYISMRAEVLGKGTGMARRTAWATRIMEVLRQLRAGLTE